jgi:hypothetical protein
MGDFSLFRRMARIPGPAPLLNALSAVLMQTEVVKSASIKTLDE